jgi:hypothetical protein
VGGFDFAGLGGAGFRVGGDDLVAGLQVADGLGGAVGEKDAGGRVEAVAAVVLLGGLSGCLRLLVGLGLRRPVGGLGGGWFVWLGCWLFFGCDGWGDVVGGFGGIGDVVGSGGSGPG